MIFRSATSLRIDESSQIGDARRRAAALADECGFDAVAQGNVAIVVSELAANLVKHAKEGELIFEATNAGATGAAATGLDVWAIDRGPGAADLSQWLQDGYSTAGTLGAGMGAIRRLSLVFDAYSQPNKGTVQFVRLPASKDDLPDATYYRRPPPPPAVRVAGLSVPIAGETLCGDGWATRVVGDRTFVLTTDGLGHGPAAYQASQEAIASLHEEPADDPVAVLQAAHQRLLPTRGAAVAVAEIDPAAGRIRYGGIGNIGAFIVCEGKTQRMVSVNGVVGAPPFRGRMLEYSFTRPATIVFFSDGLQSQVRLDGYDGLAQNDPAVIAGVLYRDFRRPRDDATAVVARLSC